MMISRIKKLLYWLPVIWRDEDWDPYYFYRILNHKLTTMEVFFREHGTHANHVDDSDKIRIARMLSQRLIDDDYLPRALKHPERLWGNRHMEWRPYSDEHCPDCSEFIEFNYDNAHTEHEIKLAEHSYRYWGRHSDKQRIRDIQYLFDWITKYIERWWD